MNEVCGRIYEGTRRVFLVQAANSEADTLLVSFEGIIRADDSGKILSGYIKELDRFLSEHAAVNAVLDFTKLQFCNSTGFYTVMDILDVVYRRVPGRVLIRRLADDDWHTETLPLLLVTLGADVAVRTIYQDVSEGAAVVT